MWDSIEYGPGQLTGGRWKPLHYIYLQSALTDVTAACGQLGTKAWRCYAKNGWPAIAFQGLLVNRVAFNDGSEHLLLFVEVSLVARPGQMRQATLLV